MLQDDASYRPDPAARRAGRGGHTEGGAEFQREFGAARGCELESVCLRGPEADVAAGMQACDFLVSMNLGKDLFWGEGLTLPQAEAMAHGCVGLAFDLPGHNAVLAPRCRVDGTGAELVRLANGREVREAMRARSLDLWNGGLLPEGCWPGLREFLDLPGTA